MRTIAILLGRTVTLAAILLGTILGAVPALAHGGLVRLSAQPDGAGGLAALTLVGAVSLLIARRRGSVHSAGEAPKGDVRFGRLIGRSR